MTTDQISFYDESLRKQIEGSFKSLGSRANSLNSFRTNETCEL